jgi:hypothetical protein
VPPRLPYALPQVAFRREDFGAVAVPQGFRPGLAQLLGLLAGTQGNVREAVGFGALPVRIAVHAGRTGEAFVVDADAIGVVTTRP